LAKEVRGAYASCIGNLIGVKYTGVELVQGCNWVMHEGGTGFSKKPKPSRWGSVLANKVWGSYASCRGNPIGVVYTGVELGHG
jgi:hypothetical protein